SFLARGSFSGGALPRSFELLRRKSNVKSGVEKRQEGPRLPPGPVLGWKREAFQGFCVFCGCPSVLHFSQINVLFLSLHFQGLS
uniref:hypothetical protein n=1 Tax=Stenotrophomonas maltophilia TaxID=40324 RepID=UPI0039C2F47C